MSSRKVTVGNAAQSQKPQLKIAGPTLPAFADLQDDLRAIWESGDLTNGKTVAAFEQAVQATMPGREVVAVSSCTSGLMLALRALDVQGEVLLPSFTFTASAHAVVWNGCTPVFVDIEADTLNIDIEDVRRKITPDTGAIVAVYVGGNPPAIEALEDLAQQHGIKLIFDAAHALGSTYQGKPAGSFGDAEVFSLSPTKTITTCEGGIVSVRDPEVARRLRIGRNYANPGDYNCEFIGLNARMSEIHALIGLRSFEALAANVAERQRLVRRYTERLRRVRGVEIQMIGAGNTCSYKDYGIRIVAEAFGRSRDTVREALAREGIETRTYFDPPVHRQDAYGPWRARAEGTLPVTDKVATEILDLPLWVGMTDADVDRVTGILEAQAAKSAVEV